MNISSKISLDTMLRQWGWFEVAKAGSDKHEMIWTVKGCDTKEEFAQCLDRIESRAGMKSKTRAVGEWIDDRRLPAANALEAAMEIHARKMESVFGDLIMKFGDKGTHETDEIREVVKTMRTTTRSFGCRACGHPASAHSAESNGSCVICGCEQ